MHYNTVIWDLDGTLLDTLDDLYLSMAYALDTAGMPPRSREEIRTFVGNGLRSLMRRAIPAGAPAEEADRLYDIFCPYYAVHCNDHTHPYEGIPALLEELRGRGVRMAIVSNKGDFAVKELAKLYFNGVIPIAVGARDGVPVKPARDLVDLALRELDADLSRAVYIGDSEVDVVTARNADLPCISLSWGFRSVETLREAGADVICDDIDALRRVLGL